MNIFGIGPLEIIFVLIIGILILGPEGMIEAGRKLGKFLRSIIKSPWWNNIRRGVNEIQYLPQKLIREAELEELHELRDLARTEVIPSKLAGICRCHFTPGWVIPLHSALKGLETMSSGVTDSGVSIPGPYPPPRSIT